MSAGLHPLDAATISRLPCGTPLIDLDTEERRMFVRAYDGLQACSISPSRAPSVGIRDGRFAVDLCNDIALAALAACVVRPWMRAGGLAGLAGAGPNVARSAESAVEHAINMTAPAWARVAVGRLASAAVQR